MVRELLELKPESIFDIHGEGDTVGAVVTFAHSTISKPSDFPSTRHRRRTFIFTTHHFLVKCFAQHLGPCSGGDLLFLLDHIQLHLAGVDGNPRLFDGD